MNLSDLDNLITKNPFIKVIFMILIMVLGAIALAGVLYLIVAAVYVLTNLPWVLPSILIGGAVAWEYFVNKRWRKPVDKK